MTLHSVSHVRASRRGDRFVSFHLTRLSTLPHSSLVAAVDIDRKRDPDARRSLWSHGSLLVGTRTAL